ncbi:FAD-binding monooxygenase [Rugosimonospora acidiphila]|uniref:FAD-binding monooxygenase n=1 Tax=Rugosimonospora acidiphila TaxID=556531 RepID=A0ABP9SST4_9ACTN
MYLERGRAVVIGASIAGLLAAQALSKTHKVVVLERDDSTTQLVLRKGVPQRRQLHVLLAQGAKALAELLPGFTDDLVAAGAVLTDPQLDQTYYLDGRAIARAPSGLTSINVSRPRLEHLVRQRVESLEHVKIQHAEALGLITERDGAVVTGVQTTDPRTPQLAADLVVDATGRGSRALHWLGELGASTPDSSRVEMDVIYVTRHYRWKAHHLDGRHGLLVAPFPGFPRGGAAVHLEEDQWAVVLFGLMGKDPSTEEAEMLAFAKSLPVPDLANLMEAAEPLDKPVKMRYPASVRWHFEKLRQHPAGFLVMGDALCSFNPTYGQGMSVAAMEALALRDLVSAGTGGLPARFYRIAAKIIDAAWALAAGGDLRFPEIKGRHTPIDRVLNGYLDRYRLAACVDPTLGRTFVQVAQMLVPASAMVSPGHLIRVLRGSRRALPRDGMGFPVPNSSGAGTS